MTLLLALVSIVAAMIGGNANFADPSHGPDYLAMREERGTLVRICGTGGCEVMRTTDYGPKRNTGDIADIALVRFADICGLSIAEARIRGECAVEIEYLEDVQLPATDTVS